MDGSLNKLPRGRRFGGIFDMGKPYIGITGFMKQKEVSAVLSAIEPADGILDRILMVGVLASLKTLRGQQNNWPKRYPKIEDISAIFPLSLNTLNLIHYNTKEPETLLGSWSN